jgi:hypothetical protein
VRRLLLALLFSGVIFAQTTQVDHYIASASTTALTVQQPAAAAARQITFGGPTVAGASVYCALASTATTSWNGAPATATAGAEVMLPGTQRPSGMTVWTGSNVGGGTTGPVYNVPAGQTFLLDLSWFIFGTQGTSENLTISTSNTCTITFAYTAVRS